MAESKYESDMLIVKKYWNNFISLIKGDINKLHSELRSIDIEIKKSERLSRILQNGQNNIEYLLSHKDYVLAIDASLSKKFDILNAFSELNGLENAVAIRTLNEILCNEKLKRVVDELDTLIDERDSIYEEIDKLSDLVRGVSFDKEIIIKYANEHNLNDQELVGVLLYPIYKSAKRANSNSKKKKESLDQNEKESLDISEQESLPSLTTEVDISNYEEYFDNVSNRYDVLKESSKLIIDKYYGILQSITPQEKQFYTEYNSITEEEFKSQKFHGKYDEAVSKIYAIKLFEIKDVIERTINMIASKSHIEKDDVDYLNECLDEYESIVNNIKEIEEKNKKYNGKLDEIEESKVFFLTDKKSEPFIPDSVRDCQSNLISIIEKANEESIQDGVESKIIPLEKIDKRFKKEVNRTVFSVRNNEIIVSYIILNSDTELTNGGIIILTASLLNPNTILDDTNRVIKENREQLVRQIEAIERGDPQQLGLQATIRDEIVKSQSQDAITLRMEEE